jgi:hypothetical protein
MTHLTLPRVRGYRITHTHHNKGLVCPAAVSMTNWLTSDTYGDTFDVQVDGDTITVARTDSPGTSWGMELGFRCTAQFHGPYDLLCGSAGNGDGTIFDFNDRRCHNCGGTTCV